MRRSPAGFTLMEVMIAVIVVGMAITVISQGFAAGTRATAVVERTTRASLLAAELISRMEAGEVDFLTETEGEFENDPETPENILMDGAGYRWTCAAEDAGKENLYQVTIRITWSDSFEDETARDFELTSYMYKEPEEEEEGGEAGG